MRREGKLAVQSECALVCLLLILLVNQSLVSCFQHRCSINQEFLSSVICSSSWSTGPPPPSFSRSTILPTLFASVREPPPLIPPPLLLPSSFPPDVPAGLRGEAVRTALLSGRCVAWNLDATPLECGVVRVQGPGCQAFLHSKLTPSFLDGNDKGGGGFDDAAGVGTATKGWYKTACLLNARGRVVDLLGVAQLTEDCAYLVTSPGHPSRDLLKRLDPFVFPLDQVTLTDYTPMGEEGVDPPSTVWTMASVHRSHVQSAFERLVAPQLPVRGGVTLPENEATAVCVPLGSNGEVLLVVPARNQLPSHAAGAAYTFAFVGTPLGKIIWEQILSSSGPGAGDVEGPIVLGPREYDALRIEAGHPAYGRELTGRDRRYNKAPLEAMADSSPHAALAASPLELHLESTLAADKGCYLGQEGVTSVLKNPRGPPRLLYQVVFPDESNRHRDDDDDSDDVSSDPPARPPRPGDQLFVLGSNQAIAVGTITSLAEPGGTGEPHTLGLALIRRADSILTQMKGLGLEISTVGDSQGAAPAMPLEGLEVIVGDTYSVGTLATVPGRRFQPQQNMFLDVPSPADAPPLGSFGEEEPDPEEVAQALFEAQKAEAEAEAAAAEVKRKEEKIEMLRRRAEEAMARRKSKKQAVDGS